MDRLSILAMILMIVLPSHLFASVLNATTEDGRSVILNEDGTWAFVASPSPQPKSHPQFRRSSWGMSKDQVKATESLEIAHETDDVIGYKTQISELDALLGYVFTEGQLSRAKYIITETHTNKNDYIADHITLKQLLTDKYGEPDDDQTYWKNDLYKTDFEEWGFAVSLGHLVYFTKWVTDSTTIYLALTGENYDLSLSLEYASKSLSDMEQKDRKKKTLEDL
ncbi:MAG: hypothetical protein ACYS0H_21920 [Planctomycetota bacterium]|jgi:hypothetical protein